MASPEPPRRAALLATLALVGFAPAWAGGPIVGEGCDSLLGRPINFNVDWQTDIKPLFNESISVEGRCTSCHNSGQLDGNLDLTDVGIDAIYKLVPAYVTPGKPNESRLFDKVNCQLPGSGGLRMPFFQNPLTIAQQELIYDWIQQGAKGEPETEAPLARSGIFRDSLESLRF
jgi:hypothetical protein